MAMTLPKLGDAPTLAEYLDLPPHPQRVAGPDRRGADGMPAIAVVTISFNAAASIRATIASIAAQRGIGKVEYVVVDGGSTDGTLDILRENADVISFWISEPDRGISDAFNKGIALTTAPVVTHVNADDTLRPGHLAAALELLAGDPGAGFCHGDLHVVTRSGATRRVVPGPEDYRRGIARYMTVNHPTTVVRREIYAKHGLFRRELRYAMDYDLVYRFADAGVRGLHSDRLLAYMEDEGVSNTEWRRAIADLQAIQMLHGAPRWKVAVRGRALRLRISIRNMLEERGLSGLARTLRRAVNIGSGKPG